MKRIVSVYLILIFINLNHDPLYAASLNLQEVYRSALERNERVQIMREELFQAHRERDKALSAMLPVLTLDGNYTIYPEERAELGDSSIVLQPEHAYNLELKLEQPLYSGGKGRRGLRIAERSIELSQKDLVLSQESLLFEVAEAFYRVLKAQKDLEARHKDLERLKEHHRQAQARFRVGEVTRTVVLRAEAELAQAEASVITASNHLAIAKETLAVLAGLPDEFELVEPALPVIPSGSLEQLERLALDQRPDLIKSIVQESQSLERVRFARGFFLPSLSLEGNYFKRDQDIRTTFFVEESWSLSAKLNFPLYEGGRRRAELREAVSEKRQAELSHALLERTLSLEVRQAFLNLETIGQVLTFREKQLAFAKENFEMVSRQFALGVATNLDVLDSDQTLMEAEADFIAAMYDHHLTILTLQKQVGLFLKETGVQGDNKGSNPRD